MTAGIKFGTDGWRGIIADDFTFANLRLVARAVAEYIKSENMDSRGVVVGYDNRFLSEKFAGAVAGVMAANGIPVFITESPTPTPVTAYGVKDRGAAGAVMITASHNPPEYNGFKFIPHYAGPALPHITREIEKNISRLSASSPVVPGPWDQEAALAMEETAVEGQIQKFNPLPAYASHIRALVDFEAITRAGLRLIVDPMYGCGIGYLHLLLEDTNAVIHEIQCCRDPLFGGSLPEPKEKLLVALRERVLQEKADLGLAMDGDADRFGIIDRDGSYITPNQFLPLLYHHLLEKRGMRGPVTRTVATTHLLDRLAEKHGQEVYETPVGFKYIGRNILEKGCVLGGEESGGLSIQGHIPEKDGMLACLLAAEIVAVHKMSLRDLLGRLHDLYGPVYSHRLDVRTSRKEKERVLRELEGYAPANIAGVRVAGKVTLDGVKFLLQDGSWVLVRPSGTEPVFRLYAEAESKERVQELQAEVCNNLGLKE